MTFEELKILFYQYQSASRICKHLAEGSSFYLIIDDIDSIELVPSDLEALKIRYDALADNYCKLLKAAAPGIDL